MRQCDGKHTDARGHDPRSVVLLDEAQILLHRPPGRVDGMEIRRHRGRLVLTIGEPRSDQVERLLGPVSLPGNVAITSLGARAAAWL